MNKTTLFFTVLLAILLFSGCTNKTETSGEINQANQNANDVSIINLISNPSEYHNKLVRVIGVGNLEFEGNAVYFSKDDLEYSVSKNGLWIELGKNATEYNIAKNFNGKYVIIEGIFNKENTGHFNMWSGSIEKISRYELWDKID